MSFEEFQREPDEEQAPEHFYRQAWGFYLIMAIVGVIWFGSHHDRLALDMFLDLRTCWIDFALGAGAAGFLILLWRSSKAFIPAMSDLEEQVRGLIGRIDRSEVLALALLSGFSEELLFRGAMQSSWGWIVATLIFALMHTGPGSTFRIWTLFALIAGGIFAALTLYRGTLLSAMIAHIVVNAVHLRQLASTGESPAPSQ